MFSHRTLWQRRPNRLSVRLDELRAGGRAIIDLTLSNPTQAGLQYPLVEIRDALCSGDILTYSPDPRGHASARTAIAGYYGEKGVHVDPHSILLTSGSSEAYAFLFRLLCEPGESVLAPLPSYPLFDYLADLSDVRLLPYQLQYDGSWHVGLDSLVTAADASTRAMLAVHPNNPTGTFLKQAELAGMAALAGERSMALIVDEVFIDYPFGSDPLRAPSTAAHDDVLTFTINGLSKAAALPQMKLGWIVVSGPADQRREALDRLEIIADTFLSVHTPGQLALPRLLGVGAGLRNQIMARTAENLGRLRAHLQGIPHCSLLSVEGGWYATVRMPAVRDDEEWALMLLEEAGILVHPGFFFDFPVGGHLVLSLLVPEEPFDAGMEAFVHVIRGS